MYHNTNEHVCVPNEINQKPDNVVNLSSYPLSDRETDILSKGLTFIPCDTRTNQVTDIEIHEFIRKMRLRFKYRNVPTIDQPLPIKSKQNPSPTNYKPLENLLNKITSTLSNIRSTPGRPNLPEDGMNLIKKLSNDKEVIINQADKGSSIVVLDRQKYVDEGHKHLSGTQTYTRLDRDITNTIKQTIKIKLDKLYESGLLSKHQYRHQTNTELV